MYTSTKWNEPWRRPAHTAKRPTPATSTTSFLGSTCAGCILIFVTSRGTQFVTPAPLKHAVLERDCVLLCCCPAGPIHPDEFPSWGATLETTCAVQLEVAKFRAHRQPKYMYVCMCMYMSAFAQREANAR